MRLSRAGRCDQNEEDAERERERERESRHASEHVYWVSERRDKEEGLKI